MGKISIGKSWHEPLDYHMRTITSCQYKLSCPLGMIDLYGKCLRCPAGSFSDVSNNRCKICPENTFSDSPGQIEQCDECKPHGYVNEDHTECLHESNSVMSVPQIVYLHIPGDNIRKKKFYKDFFSDSVEEIYSKVINELVSESHIMHFVHMKMILDMEWNEYLKKDKSSFNQNIGNFFGHVFGWDFILYFSLQGGSFKI